MELLSFVRFKFFHWFYYQWKKHYYFNFSIGLLTWIYQGLKLPFDAGIDNTSNFFILFFILIPFGLAWPVLSYTVDFVVKNLLKFKVVENEHRAFGVLMIKILIFVHAALVLQGYFCYWECFSVRGYLELWLKSMILVGGMYFILTLFARNRFFHFSKKEDAQKGKFEFKGSGKKSLWLNLENLIYIKSDDNYVDLVNLNENGEVSTEILRTTLGSISKQLAPHGEFVRIHRSFIVNLRYVKKLTENKILVIGNNDSEFKMAVSDTYFSKLKNLLSP